MLPKTVFRLIYHLHGTSNVTWNHAGSYSTLEKAKKGAEKHLFIFPDNWEETTKSVGAIACWHVPHGTLPPKCTAMYIDDVHIVEEIIDWWADVSTGRDDNA